MPLALLPLTNHQQVRPCLPASACSFLVRHTSECAPVTPNLRLAESSQVKGYPSSNCKSATNWRQRSGFEGGYREMQFVVVDCPDMNHRDAAASTIPVPLKAGLLVTTISTGYFHSMNCFQPRLPLAGPPNHRYCASLLPQYANFLPKYLPMYGTMTMLSKSSNCCKLSFHSFSASDSS
jgi:hypothetical protein